MKLREAYTELENRYETIPHDYNRTQMEELLREMKMAFLSAQPSHMFGLAKACEIVQKYVDNDYVDNDIVNLCLRDLDDNGIEND